MDIVIKRQIVIISTRMVLKKIMELKDRMGRKAFGNEDKHLNTNVDGKDE